MRATQVAAAIVGLLLLGFIVVLATSPAGRNSSFNFEIVGSPAPPIQGTTLDGSVFDLADRQGSWVVVNFFASWCVGCRVEHPELAELVRRHPQGDVGVVGVMFGDTEESARRFFDQLGGDWPAIVDPDVVGRIAIDYGTTGVPETVLVAPTGRVVQKWVGANGVTADSIDGFIDAFTEGSEGSGG